MKRTSAKSAPSSQTGQEDPAVRAFLQELEHPCKDDLLLVRQRILGVDPAIREAIKWNSASFRTTDFFATFNLRYTKGIQLVFHMGAKAKTTGESGVQIADPAGILDWRAKDRCLVTLGKGRELEGRLPALEAVVREWLRHLATAEPV
jgi:hypothetical protein